MKSDRLREYVRLRSELATEREAIKNRLKQISEALGRGANESMTVQDSPSAQAAAPQRGTQAAGSGSSLRDHVLAVLNKGPQTKEELLDAVEKRGYKFTTKNPLNSLGVILYGKKPRFARANGKFSLPGASPQTDSQSGRGSSAPFKASSGKRQMSEAGRKAIANAARKRWAAAKRAGKNKL